MNITHTGWLSPDCIATGIAENSRDAFLEKMISILSKSGCVTDTHKVFEDIRKREQASEPLIMNGIILPHAQSNGVTALCAAAGILKPENEVEFEDGTKFKACFIVVWPQNTQSTLKHIAALTELVSRKETGSVLSSAQNADDIFQYLYRTGVV